MHSIVARPTDTFRGRDAGVCIARTDATWDDGRVSTTPGPRPAATGPVRGRVAVPGSKSVTNRALLLAALSGGPATVSGAPPTRDTALMVDALRALGVPIDVDGEHVAVRAHDGLRGGGSVDCGLAGTVMRFVPPAAALADGPVRFDGDPRARERPMGTVLDALRVLGARIDGDRPPVHPARHRQPARRRGRDRRVGVVAVRLGAAAVGRPYEKGVTVVHDGKPVPSLPHIDMSVAMLRTAGVEVDDAEPNIWRVAPGRDRAAATGPWSRTCPTRRCSSPPPPSPAARSPSPAGPSAPTQPGVGILPVLEQFGAYGRARPGRA